MAVGLTGIADGAVTTAKLADQAVTNAKIANSTISTAKLAFTPAIKVGHVQVDANTTTISFSSLDLTKEKVYLIMVNLKNATTGTVNVDVYINGDSTRTNYYRQRLMADGTTVSGARYNDPAVFPIEASERTNGYLFLWVDPDGYVKGAGYAVLNTGDTIKVYHNTLSSTFTVSQVTSIDLTAQTANGIAAGSHVWLYKFEV